MAEEDPDRARFADTSTSSASVSFHFSHYGLEDGHSQPDSSFDKIIWGDDPNKSYFEYLMKAEQKKRRNETGDASASSDTPSSLLRWRPRDESGTSYSGSLDQIIWGDNPNQSYFEYMLKAETKWRETHDHGTPIENKKKNHDDGEVNQAEKKPPIVSVDCTSQGWTNTVSFLTSDQQSPQDGAIAVNHTRFEPYQAPFYEVPMVSPDEENRHVVLNYDNLEGEDVPSVIYLAGSPHHIKRKPKPDTAGVATAGVWSCCGSQQERRKRRKFVFCLLLLLSILLMLVAGAIVAVALLNEGEASRQNPTQPPGQMGSPSPPQNSSSTSTTNSGGEQTVRPATTAPTVGESAFYFGGSPTDPPTVDAVPTMSPTQLVTPATAPPRHTISPPSHDITTDPTWSPTVSPTESPTDSPTSTTASPTATRSVGPTESPTNSPSRNPTQPPVAPTPAPTRVTNSPTLHPTLAVTDRPTQSPTAAPTRNTRAPTAAPTRNPTQSPTGETISTPVPTTLASQILQFLAESSPDGGAALADSNSPQYQAASWLIGNSAVASYSDDEKLRRYAMSTLYFSTNGDQWNHADGWLSDEDECLWHSQSAAPCDNGELVALHLEDNNMEGSIPAELVLLSSLETVYLRNNSLHGRIPTDLGALRNIERLQLTRNNLSGQVPSFLSRIPRLRVLGLGRNALTGRIPSSFGDFSDIDTLGLERNQLSGAIPTFMGQMTRVRILNLDHNLLSGTIPTELSNLRLLEAMNLRSNDFTGVLPDGLCATSPQIQADCDEIFCSCCTACCTDDSDECFPLRL